jgi:hypothetical protein
MKPVKKYEGQYSVTKDGRVWSHKSEKWISPFFLKTGYARIGLRDAQNKNERKCFLVHRLVAQAYLPNKDNKPEVHHKDADRKNNHVQNLQWVTREENNQAAWDSGNKTHVVTEKFLVSVRKNAEVARAKKMERLNAA